MHTETLTLQRIFGVARREWKGRKWTEFGFEAAEGRTVHSARVFGHPVLREAMHITVVMPRKNAWTAICAWFDHEDGSLRLEGTGVEWRYVIGLSLCVGMILLPLLFARETLSGLQLGGYAAMLAPALLVLLGFAGRLWRKIQAGRLLRQQFPGARCVSG